MNYAKSCLSSARIANVYIHHIIEVEAIKYISSLKWNWYQSDPSQRGVGEIELALDLKPIKKSKTEKKPKPKSSPEVIEK